MRKKELLSIAFVISLLIIFVLYTKPQDILATDFEFQIRYILFAIPFTLSAHVLLGFRYWYFLKDNNREYHILDSISIHFITPILARITPGNIGETKKIFNHRIIKEDAIFTHVLERLTDFLILFISGLGIFIIFDLVEKLLYAYIVIFLLLILLILILFYLDRITAFLFEKTPLNVNIENKWMKKRLETVDNRVIIVFLITSVCIWLVTIQVYVNLARSVGISIDSFSLSIIIAATIILLSVSGLPGGFGIREISLTFLLVQWGIALEQASIYSLLISIYLISVETVLATISYIYRNKYIHNSR